MNHQDWQERTRQLNGQVAAITGRDLGLWLFTFIVVFIVAMGVLLLGFSNPLWTQASHSFRGSDLVLRYDVRRFLVIMPDTKEQQARCARKRMLDRLDSWLLESNADFRIGLATYSRGADANGVLQLAEERLQSGRRPTTADEPSPDPASYGPRREL